MQFYTAIPDIRLCRKRCSSHTEANLSTANEPVSNSDLNKLVAVPDLIESANLVEVENSGDAVTAQTLMDGNAQIVNGVDCCGADEVVGVGDGDGVGDGFGADLRAALDAVCSNADGGVEMELGDDEEQLDDCVSDEESEGETTEFPTGIKATRNWAGLLQATHRNSFTACTIQ